ncbi:MAG: adenosylcobinamide-GDP ribazoletransferase [Myxacorys californica WJT36-NPBG1]|nr:adenosylcobinamide-GDP ribazoletransferase [Myxacorys californica WJT36-NPBG1]
MVRQLRVWIAQILAAMMFYTCLPIPSGWTLEFRGIARVAPLIGVVIGGLVGLLDWGLAYVGMPLLTRSAIAVAVWIALTGGLHLDGAMDTADGLAVTDPQRRLQAMSDSVTGAFGAIAAIVILLLKTVALSEIDRDRIWVLMAVAGWGRWGQLVAIVLYPYLKPTGKGAFHKESIRSLWEVLPSFLLLFGLSGTLYEQPIRAIALLVGGGAIGLLVGAWLDRKLGGQTGDTYGAIVEWTEALLLCLLTVF